MEMQLLTLFPYTPVFLRSEMHMLAEDFRKVIATGKPAGNSDVVNGKCRFQKEGGGLLQADVCQIFNGRNSGFSGKFPCQMIGGNIKEPCDSFNTFNGSILCLHNFNRSLCPVRVIGFAVYDTLTEPAQKAVGKFTSQKGLKHSAALGLVI